MLLASAEEGRPAHVCARACTVLTSLDDVVEGDWLFFVVGHRDMRQKMLAQVFLVFLEKTESRMQKNASGARGCLQTRRSAVEMLKLVFRVVARDFPIREQTQSQACPPASLPHPSAYT